MDLPGVHRRDKGHGGQKDADLVGRATQAVIFWPRVPLRLAEKENREFGCWHRFGYWAIALRRRIPTRCDILNVRLCISFSGGLEMVQNSVVYNKNRKFGNLDLKSLEICGDKKLPQPKLAENLLPRSAKDVPSTCYYQTWQV